MTRQQLQAIFEGKKVLITGHTGFKGSWLCVLMLELGAKVCGISKDAFSLQNSCCHTVLDKHSHIFDITDQQQLKEVVVSFQPDIVFHLAAQSLVLESYKQPVATYQSNIMGTVSVLESLLYLPKPVYSLFATTDKVYADQQLPSYKETDKLGGYDPYSTSKACCELIIDSWRNSFFPTSSFDSHKKALTVVRAVNVIGGGDMNVSRLFPSCIQNLKDHKAITIRNKKAVRHFQYILDVLHTYVLLIVKLIDDPKKYSQPWNVASSQENILDIVSFVKKVMAIYGEGSYQLIDDSTAKHETQTLALDNSQLKQALHWQSSTGIDEIITRSLAFYQRQEQEPVYQLMVEEIQRYYSN